MVLVSDNVDFFLFDDFVNQSAGMSWSSCSSHPTVGVEFVFSSYRHGLLLQDVYRNSMPASSFQQQKLRVCEVCSAYLGLHDNDRRLADHFGGKLHLGFIEIREKLDKLRVSLLRAP